MNGVIKRAIYFVTVLYDKKFFFNIKLYRANEMNFGINHAPGAGLKTRPVTLQFIAFPLCYAYPPGKYHPKYYAKNTIFYNTYYYMSIMHSVNKDTSSTYL